VHKNFSCNPENSTQLYNVIKIDKRNETLTSYKSIIENLQGVRNPNDLIKFLKKNIKWNFLVQCLNSNQIASKESNQARASNLFFSSKFLCRDCKEDNEIDKNNASCGDNDDDVDDDHYFACIIKKNYKEFLILGVISLLGNVVAIIYEINTLIQESKTEAKERKVYHVLVLNLCLAYLLMAIYLIMFPYTLAHTNCSLADLNISCEAFGVISVASIQVSMSILVIISVYRLRSVLYPFKRIRFKVALILIVLVWIVWLFVAAVPLFNKIILAHSFTRGVLVYSKMDLLTRESVEPECHGLIDFASIANFVQILANSCRFNETLFSLVLKSIDEHQTNELFLQLLSSFSLVDSNFSLIEYYNPYGGCSINIFFSATDTHSSTPNFTAFLLISSLAGYIFILIAYGIILKNVSASQFKTWLSRLTRHICSVGEIVAPIQQIRNENRQIYIRLFFVALSDLMCGVVASVMGLVFYFKIKSRAGSSCILPEIRVFKRTGQRIIIFFFFNSVINPFIYCFPLFQGIYKRCKSYLRMNVKAI